MKLFTVCKSWDVLDMLASFTRCCPFSLHAAQNTWCPVPCAHRHDATLKGRITAICCMIPQCERKKLRLQDMIANGLNNRSGHDRLNSLKNVSGTCGSRKRRTGLRGATELRTAVLAGVLARVCSQDLGGVDESAPDRTSTGLAGSACVLSHPLSRPSESRPSEAWDDGRRLRARSGAGLILRCDCSS